MMTVRRKPRMPGKQVFQFRQVAGTDGIHRFHENRICNGRVGHIEGLNGSAVNLLNLLLRKKQTAWINNLRHC
jgi:hypothetical protein